jgi:Phosphate-selective porin O and P
MKKTLLSLAVASAISTSLFADAETDTLRAQLKALTERLDSMENKNSAYEEKSAVNAKNIQANSEKADALLEETANLQTGFNFNVVDTDFSHNGMGAAASKVYKSKSPLSIGGYGEMFYASKEDADNIADVYRFVPYIGYRFNENIVLNVEIEFEHGGANGGSGEAIVEFMYLDFMLTDAFNIQVGHVLTPMGLINLRHEPTLFNTVQRPNTEKYLLPSTWHTNGAIAYGAIGESGFTYNAGIIQALDFNNEDSGSKGQIREARAGSTKNSTFNNAAFVGRLDYIGTPGLMVGASLYYGTGTQGSVSDTTATMYDVHATYENSGFKAKALYTATKIDDADKIAGATTLQDGITPATGKSISDANGYYVNVEYDVLNLVGSEYKLPVFVQYDYINPTDKVVDANNNDIGIDVNAESATTTVGVNFFPHEQVVLKMDYAMTDYKDAGTTKQDQDIFSLSLGFIF